MGIGAFDGLVLQCFDAFFKALALFYLFLKLELLCLKKILVILALRLLRVLAMMEVRDVILPNILQHAFQPFNLISVLLQ